MTDPIGDMLTRIRNASILLKETVEVPFSKLAFKIGKILEREGFVRSVEIRRRRMKRFMEIGLKYDQKTPMLSGLKRISKPGQRIYGGPLELRKIKRSGGIAIVSTSKGVMTDREARKQNAGGEVLCEVW